MGFILYGLGYSVPLMKRDLGISRATASLHQTAFAVMLIVSSLFLNRFISRFSATFAMKTGWLIVVLGIGLYTWGQSIWITVPSYGLAAFGATLFNNTNAASLGQVPGNSLKLMFRTTGISTGLGAFAPMVIAILVAKGISWRLVLFLIALIVGLISYYCVPEVSHRSPAPRANGRISKDFILIIFFGFAANFLEVAVGAWALDLLIQRDYAKSIALVLATFFSFGISFSRLGFSFRVRYGQMRIWIFSSVLTFTGLFFIIFSTSGLLTFIGLTIASLGIGPVSAIALAYASDSPDGAYHGIAANASGAAVALGVGPGIIGYVSDRFSFSIAYGISAIMLVFATVVFLVVRKERAKHDLDSMG
jgi:predicted MFS family arabinose efflux permease